MNTAIRFLFVGMGNTVLGLAVILAARQFVSDYLANLIGYLLVVPVSFLTHRDFSFRDRGNKLHAFMRYLPTVAVGYFANLLALREALSIGLDPNLSQTLAIAAHVLTTFLLSKYAVFLTPPKP